MRRGAYRRSKRAAPLAPFAGSGGPVGQRPETILSSVAGNDAMGGIITASNTGLGRPTPIVTGASLACSASRHATAQSLSPR